MKLRLGGSIWALAALLALLHGAPALVPCATPPSLLGQPAPAFALPHLHERDRTVSPELLRGRVWVLNVWASWCAPCRDEHPLLVDAARDDRVTIVGLNHADDPRSAQEWLRRLGDPYAEAASDPEGRVGAAYGLRGVPASFVIDREGVVRFEHAGPLTREVWARDVVPLVRRLQP